METPEKTRYAATGGERGVQKKRREKPWAKGRGDRKAGDASLS